MTVTHLALTTEALLFPQKINSTNTESYLLYPVAYNRLESLYLKRGESTTCSDYMFASAMYKYPEMCRHCTAVNTYPIYCPYKSCIWFVYH